MLRAAACDGREEYPEALHYTEAYSKLTRIDNPSDEDLKFIDKFNGWAQVNNYLYRLMMGDKDVIYPYVQYIEKDEAEILPALVKIMEAANNHDMDVDFVLDKFDPYIMMYSNTYGYVGSYNELITNGRYIQFLKELTIYQLDKGRFEQGFQHLLHCLASAKNMKSESVVIQCVGLFERFRDSASTEMKNKYRNLIEEVYSNYEKKAALIVVLFSAVLLFTLYPQPSASTPVLYSTQTHGAGGM